MSKFETSPDVLPINGAEPLPRLLAGSDLRQELATADPPREREATAEEIAGQPKFAPTPVRVELTIDACPGGYLSCTFDNPQMAATRLTPRQALALKAVTSSLNQQNARMANGVHVTRSPDALRWLLDKIADQLPPELVESARAAA